MYNRSVLALSLTLALGSLYGGGAQAETPAEAAARELDITMTVVEDDTPDQAIQLITLPPSADAQGDAASETGIGIANTARDQGRELGATISEEARALGETARSLGQEGSTAVRETVKDAISRGDLQAVPGEVRDNLPTTVQDTIPEALPELPLETQ